MIQNMEIGHHFTLLSVLREERNRLKNVQINNQTLENKRKNTIKHIGDRKDKIKRYQTIIGCNLQKQLQQNQQALIQIKYKIKNLQRQFNQCLASLQFNIREIRSRKSMVQKVETMTKGIQAQISQFKQSQGKLILTIEGIEKDIAKLNQIYDQYKEQVLIGQERVDIAQHKKSAQILLYNNQCQNLRKTKNQNLMINTKNGDLHDMLALFENKIENVTKESLEICDSIAQIQTNKSKIQKQIEQMGMEIQRKESEFTKLISSIQQIAKQKSMITTSCKQIQSNLIMTKTSHSVINRKSSQTLNKISSIQLLQQLLHKVIKQVKQ